MKPAQQRRIELAFTYHPPRDAGQARRYEEIRYRLKELAYHLVQVCPDSRELNTALKYLEEVQSWSIAAIARNESEPGPMPDETRLRGGAVGSSLGS